MLKLWEIASVAVPCMLVAFVAITIVCFVQERKVSCHNGLIQYTSCPLFPLNRILPMYSGYLYCSRPQLLSRALELSCTCACLTLKFVVKCSQRAKAARIPATLPSPVVDAWTFNSRGMGIQSGEGAMCRETTAELITSAIEVRNTYGWSYLAICADVQ